MIKDEYEKAEAVLPPTTARRAEEQDDDEASPDNYQAVEESKPEPISTFQAVMLMNGFCVTGVLSQFVVKLAGDYNVNAFDFSMARTITNIVMSTIAIKGSGKSLYIPKELRGYLAARIVIGYTAWTLMVTAMMIIPLTFFSVIFGTAPFWAALIGWLVLGDAVSTTTLVCMLCSFCGIYLLVTGQENDQEVDFDKSNYAEGIFQSIFCAISFASIGVLTRIMKDLHYTQVSSYHAYGSFILNLIILTGQHIYNGDTVPRFFTYEPMAYVYMVSAGAFSSLSLILSTKASQGEKTAFIQMITYMRSVYSFGLDTVYFGSVFNGQELVGAALVLAFTIIAVLTKK